MMLDEFGWADRPRDREQFRSMGRVAHLQREIIGYGAFAPCPWPESSFETCNPADN